MMKKILFATIFSLAFCSIPACAQNKSAEKTSDNKNSTIKKTQQTMDLSKITNTTVNAAMTAWQNGDSKMFLSLFTSNPTMTDDGNPRDFQGFVKEACGEEKFLTRFC